MAQIDPELVEKGPYGRMVRATILLDKHAFDRNGTDVGKIHDLFGTRDGPVLGNVPAYRIEHIVAGPGAFGDRLGYERGDMKGPWALAVIAHKLKSRAIGFRWADIDRITEQRVYLNRTRSELQRLREMMQPDHSGRGVGDAAYLGLRLLDSQITDKTGLMCGNVDDLELTLGRGRAAPYVSGILAGPGALAHRLGGRLGLWVEGVHKRLHPGEGETARIDFADVDRVWHHVELLVGREGLPVNRFEEWTRDHFIAKIPGAK